MKGPTMNKKYRNPRPSLIAAAAHAVAITSAPDREHAIHAELERLYAATLDVPSELAMNPTPEQFELLRAAFQFGYEQRDADGRLLMGKVGTMLEQLKPVIDRCAAQLASGYPSTPGLVSDAHRPDFEALAAFLHARDRKCDDGDSLQAYADAETALTARLGLSSGLDRLEQRMVERRQRQKNSGDLKGANATQSALNLLRTLK